MHQLKIFDHQLENIYHFHLSIPWRNPWRDDILTYLLYNYRKSISLHNSKESRNFNHHKLTKKHFPLALEGVEELQESSWPTQT
jgi:hypothetical protein